MNYEAFVKLTPTLSTFERDIYFQPLLAAMDEFAISATPARERAFIAQLLHETQGLKVWKENLNYSAQGLLKTFGKYFTKELAIKYARKPEAIANRVYANRLGNGPESSGDGWKHRGMGPFQLTGKDNQGRCGDYLHVDLRSNPELLLTPEIGFRSAGWFFVVEKSLLDEADKNTLAYFLVICKSTNGGWNGKLDRIRLWNLARKVIL